MLFTTVIIQVLEFESDLQHILQTVNTIFQNVIC